MTFTITKGTNNTIPSGYVYQLNAGAPVEISADGAGAATVTVSPTRVTNTLTVTSLSAGGNFGDSASVTFNADPAAVVADGDLTGDDVPDLLTVGKTNGIPSGLWLASGKGNDGIDRVGTNIGVRGNGVTGNNAPSDFDGGQAITGHFTGTGLQDVLVYYPGGTNPGSASILRANGDGSVIQAQLSGNQFSVFPDMLLDENGLSPLQLANAGNPRNDDTLYPDLIGTSGDATTGYHLTYYPNLGMTGGYLGAFHTTATTPTGGDDWNNWTITTAQTPTGTAMFLWNKTTGALHLWTNLTINPDTGQATYTPYNLATNWNTGANITLRAADINNDGTPDLWTTGPNGTITTWTISNLTNGTGTTTKAADQALITPDHNWQFAAPKNSDPADDGEPADQPVTTAEDVSGGKALSVEGTNVMWRSGDLFSPALMMNVGSEGTADTSGQGALSINEPLIDTTKSFSISVWAKPLAAGGVIASEDGANASRFLLWNNASDNTWRFGMGNADSGWSYTQVVTSAGRALGVWTHLVATYNAETRTISLYVDGVLKGSAQYTATPTWPSTGKFVVGRYLYQGAHTAHYAGMLSNLQVWKRALTPAQVGASNDTKRGSLVPFGAITWTPPGTGAAQTDIYAADADGNLWRYRKPFDPVPPNQLATGKLVSTGWNQFTSFGIADMDHDGYPDLVVRDNTSCNLQIFLGTPDDLSPTPTFFGAQWCNYRPFGVADYNRDGYQDVFTAGPTNDLWAYPGDLKGGKLTRIDIGDGWSTDHVGYGIADVVGDATPDLYGRQTSTGLLRLYNFPAGAAGITQVGNGWGGYTSFGLTDYDRDGKPDVIARENSTGILWMYPGAANGMLGARTQIASNF